MPHVLFSRLVRYALISVFAIAAGVILGLVYLESQQGVREVTRGAPATTTDSAGGVGTPIVRPGAAPQGPGLKASPRPAGHVAQGFGALTSGGNDKAVVHVTNLSDSGPGSLREALSGGGRKIVFDVGGDINLSDFLYVQGAQVTIDGTSAPAPGITLKNRGLIIRGNKGAHDVIVRGIRVRNSSLDGIQVSYDAYNVLIENVSVDRSADGNIDITEGSHDVTVAWSILTQDSKNMLIKYNPSRISINHNAFIANQGRNPEISKQGDSAPASEISADFRNNLVWGWRFGSGTGVKSGAWANIVNNYYASQSQSGNDQSQALMICNGDGTEHPSSLTYCNGGSADAAARAYAKGNYSADGVDLDAFGNESRPFPAAAVDAQTACEAAQQILTESGARPLDAIDQQYLSAIRVNSC